jgi:hypothetical protein
MVSSIVFGQGPLRSPQVFFRFQLRYSKVESYRDIHSSTSQVLRATYRFKGPMKSGPALGAVLLNQSWRLRSERLSGETRFRPLSGGITGGYYIHVGKHFYIYPMGAYTYNTVVSGQTALQGFNYKVEKWGPNGSLHIGWEWGL